MKVIDLAYDLPNRRLFSKIGFDTAEDALVIIEGQNGSGKSTLLKLILGLLKPSAGQVVGNERIGFVPDSSSNYFLGMTPKLLFHFLQEQFELEAAHCQALLDEMQAGLSFPRSLLDSKIQDLSLGEKKKVMLMAAWLLSPQLFVMDEPFSGLDEASLVYLKRLIEADLTAGKQFIIVTHDQKDLLAAKSRVISLGG